MDAVAAWADGYGHVGLVLEQRAQLLIGRLMIENGRFGALSGYGGDNKEQSEIR